MKVSKVTAFFVFMASVASLITMWVVFLMMWVRGKTSLTLSANRFGEFWIELFGLTLAILFLPVLFYEIQLLLRASVEKNEDEYDSSGTDYSSR